MTIKCIFISHSAKEPETADFLELLSSKLKEESFDVLVDRKCLNFGEDWKYEICNWIGSCNCALILLSKNAIENSKWVVREVNILLWRRTLDPNFILIPIYFGVTPEDVKNNELFDGLDLGKYHGLIDGKTEDLIKVLKEKLGQELELTTPLDKIADLIEERLKCLSRNTIEKILNELHVEISPLLLNRNPGFALAMKMLNLRLRESARILNKLRDYLEPRDLGLIFQLLAPSWVDLRAANCISKCVSHEEHNEERKKVIVLNASTFFSAEMYVRRASNRLPNIWPIYRPLCVHGTDPVTEIVTEIETLLIEDLLPRRFDDDMNLDYKRKLLKSTLINRNKEENPVFIALKYSKTIAKLLPKLQENLPFVTFFLLTGENFPEENEFEGLRFEFLKPPLESKAENQAYDEYYIAYGLTVY
jgi:hypothetical protein